MFWGFPLCELLLGGVVGAGDVVGGVGGAGAEGGVADALGGCALASPVVRVVWAMVQVRAVQAMC